MEPLVIEIKLTDLVLDPARPGLAATLPEDRVLAMVQKAYGFLAANMRFEIRGDVIVISVDIDREYEVQKVEAIFTKAIGQAKAGRFNKAVDLLRRVLTIVPEHQDARRNLAMALISSERFSEAKDVLVDILLLEPDNAWAHMLLGKIFTTAESDPDVGGKYYAKAYDLAPEDVYTITNYAAFKTEQGDHTGARHLYERAIEINPDVPNSYYGLALILADLGMGSDALAVLDQMFDNPQIDHRSHGELIAECRQSYLQLCAVIADTSFEEYWEWVEEYRSELENQSGRQIQLESDPSLGSTTALSEATPDGAIIRYNAEARAVVPALVTRELERCRKYIAGTANLKPAQGSTTRETVEGFINRAATDALIDMRLHSVANPIRPSLFVELFLRIDEQSKALPIVSEQSYVLGELAEQFECLAAATAFFSDRLYHPRTAYGELYARSPVAPQARELADEWAERGGRGLRHE